MSIAPLQIVYLCSWFIVCSWHRLAICFYLFKLSAVVKGIVHQLTNILPAWMKILRLVRYQWYCCVYFSSNWNYKGDSDYQSKEKMSILSFSIYYLFLYVWTINESCFFLSLWQKKNSGKRTLYGNAC